jgi:hypothetical protein
LAHHITAIITTDAVQSDVPRHLDLVAVPLGSRLTLFHVDHYYTAYWQAVRKCTELLDVPPAFPAEFPREGIVSQLVSELTARSSPVFALLRTEYFGGVGDQWACAFTGNRRDSPDDAKINEVLRILGVARRDGLDEFDTIGLGAHRSSPDYLARYRQLCDDLGVSHRSVLFPESDEPSLRISRRMESSRSSGRRRYRRSSRPLGDQRQHANVEGPRDPTE